MTCGAVSCNSDRITGRRLTQLLPSRSTGTRRLNVMILSGGTRLGRGSGADVARRGSAAPTAPSSGTATAAATSVLSPVRRVGPAVPVMCPLSPREPG